jgi:pimeloyl-ACP methyl ester carboxylesterase/predicted glycosyltransferase
MRARQPDVESYVECRGAKIGYEVFGDGPLTIVFAPTDVIVQSQCWKAQAPHLARRHRVITIDPPGNGRSDRTLDPAPYGDDAAVETILSVMDAEAVDRAVLVGLCSSGWRALVTAARHPERVVGVVSVGTQAPYVPPLLPHKVGLDVEIRRETYEGWEKVNNNYLRQDLRGFAEWFFSEMLPEPHSTKQHEDAVRWALDAGECLLVDEPLCVDSAEQTEAVLRQVSCPTLMIHGSRDNCQSADRGRRAAELTGAEFLLIEGAGHLPQAREPVVVNRAIDGFLSHLAPPSPAVRRWTRAMHRPKRVLYLSSPIGLGHARRDIAIAEELRRVRPDVQVHWLAQPPLTELLERRGEWIHPASSHLAGETAHIESEAGEHDVHVFQAIREMDEILVHNFMVFDELVTHDPYDVVVGDEAWELDYFLHENPELKRSPFVWLTDFVGWLPMPDGGDHEALLAADYNAEMVEQVARYPRVRDLSLFVGNPDDIVPAALGPSLPGVREWTEHNFDFVGYITGFDPVGVTDREALRADLGYGDDDRVCVVSVGGSGVGAGLLRRLVAAYPLARERVPGLRMVLVTGPRIDPTSIRAPREVEVHGFVPDLYRHLAVCDLAVVQGGLTTTMELTANRRPFVYLPLRHHFEQNFHVRHRLDRYGAGRCVDYDEAQPDVLAALIETEIGRQVDYLPVECDGAQRAAERIAELL